MLRWLEAALLMGILFGAVQFQKRRALEQFASRARLGAMTSGVSHVKRWLRFLLFLAALALVIVGLAEPQSAGVPVEVQHHGVDIVIAVDVSDSMLAQDIRPSRLEKAKLELQDLVETSRGDRIGVVAFAGEAYTQVPLTLDRGAVKLFLKAVSPESIPVPGTAIGNAIRASMALFDSQFKGEKVVLLLTDGEDHGSDPLGAAQQAAQSGVRIYTIGFGSPEGEVIPMKSGNDRVQFKKDLTGNVVLSKLDEKTLVEVARITGGIYFRSAKGLLNVEKIYQSILSLEKQKTGTGTILQYDPYYQTPVFLAVILILLGTIMSDSKRETRR
ncbi:MAG: VWA domain-containing protein [Candidatus Omnitrophica bacterium]|nr:VWA domain-containing protein [Candidatus Omnitrophota bacterium]